MKEEKGLVEGGSAQMSKKAANPGKHPKPAAYSKERTEENYPRHMEAGRSLRYSADW